MVAHFKFTIWDVQFGDMSKLARFYIFLLRKTLHLYIDLRSGVFDKGRNDLAYSFHQMLSMPFQSEHIRPTC